MKHISFVAVVAALLLISFKYKQTQDQNDNSYRVGTIMHELSHRGFTFRHKRPGDIDSVVPEVGIR